VLITDQKEKIDTNKVYQETVGCLNAIVSEIQHYNTKFAQFLQSRISQQQAAQHYINETMESNFVGLSVWAHILLLLPQLNAWFKLEVSNQFNVRRNQAAINVCGDLYFKNSRVLFPPQDRQVPSYLSSRTCTFTALRVLKSSIHDSLVLNAQETIYNSPEGSLRKSDFDKIQYLVKGIKRNAHLVTRPLVNAMAKSQFQSNELVAHFEENWMDWLKNELSKQGELNSENNYTLLCDLYKHVESYNIYDRVITQIKDLINERISHHTEVLAIDSMHCLSLKLQSYLTQKYIEKLLKTDQLNLRMRFHEIKDEMDTEIYRMSHYFSAYIKFNAGLDKCQKYIEQYNASLMPQYIAYKSDIQDDVFKMYVYLNQAQLANVNPEEVGKEIKERQDVMEAKTKTFSSNVLKPRMAPWQEKVIVGLLLFCTAGLAAAVITVYNKHYYGKFSLVKGETTTHKRVLNTGLRNSCSFWKKRVKEEKSMLPNSSQALVA